MAVSAIAGSSPHTRGAHPLPRPARLGGGSSPHTRGARSRVEAPPARCRDHPRIRGEHLMTLLAWSASWGSSPHTRGAQPFFLAERRDNRIIPAYAGSTKTARTTPRSTRDHPRIRGEHACPVGSPRPATGSSPHTRGALEGSSKGERVSRIIPAYAGSTRRPCDPKVCLSDHPRIRGEHGDPDRGPPRGWWIIPAYAGSTRLLGRSPGRRPDHPRIRGEHVQEEGDRDDEGQIIPAYAGSTCISRRQGVRKWDHPRIRGEHGSSSATIIWSTGSSPHTRGALGGADGFRCVPGIIPAYAGSTVGVGVRLASPRDHPRIRGEHREAPTGYSRGGGSSPHTRGAHQRTLGRHQIGGIIPAYAGSTTTATSM